MKVTEVFCKNLRQMRKEKGLTQEKLSQQAGISYNFISQLERGVKIPTLRTLERLAEALHCDPLDLLQGQIETENGEKKIIRILQRLDKKKMELAKDLLKVLAYHSHLD